MGGDSTAAGGFARRPSTEIHVDSSLVVPENQQNSLPNRQLPLVNAAVDKANIAKIVAERPRGMSETEALALALDGVVRAAIHNGAIHKLALQTIEPWTASLASTMLEAGTLITGTITTARAIASTIFDTHFDSRDFRTAAALYGGAFIYDSFLNWRRAGSLQLKRRQWSLSGNFHMPDRALVAAWVAKELTFVKYRPRPDAR